MSKDTPPIKPKHIKVPMLPPEEPIEIAEPGSSGETITQVQLRQLHEAQEEAEEATRRYEALLDKVTKKYMRGASPQPGAYHLEPRMSLHRRPSYKTEVILLRDEEYARQILARTRPKPHFRVIIK